MSLVCEDVEGKQCVIFSNKDQLIASIKKNVSHQIFDGQIQPVSENNISNTVEENFKRRQIGSITIEKTGSKPPATKTIAKPVHRSIG